MNIVDNFLARLGYAKAAPDPRPPAEMLSMAHGYRWEIPDASSHERQTRLYALNTWIRTAVDHTAALAAGGVYSVAKLVGEPGGANDEDIPNHEFERLLRRPNPSQSRREFLRDCISWSKTTGNLYIFKNALDENTKPAELWLVPSTMIVPVPDGNSYIRGYLFTPPGAAVGIPIEPWHIVHLKTWNPLNPFVGLSPVQTLALTAMGDIAQEKFNLSFFDKDAGRFPGFLAFKHNIAQPEWDRMIRERDEQWGGTNRAAITMLRNVGDTVQYLPAAATQKEMEFLESQGFTRSKIYGYLAPGLDSVLAINATQANSDAGKATLIELGVWPWLEDLGQKFETELLPLYGDNLVGAFDEMRPSKLALNIAEVETEAKFFTVNEIRERRFKAEPMYLDESQVAALDEDMAQEGENRDMALAQLNTGNGFAPKPGAPAKATEPPSDKPKTDTGTVMDKDGKPRKLDPRGLMLAAQIGPATPLPGDPATPPPAPPMPPVAPPPGNAAPDKDDVAPPQAKAAELAAWERLQVKHLHDTDWQFTPKVLDVFTVGRIRAALKAAVTEDAVRGVFAKERGGGGDALTDAVAELKRFNDLASPR